MIYTFLELAIYLGIRSLLFPTASGTASCSSRTFSGGMIFVRSKTVSATVPTNGALRRIEPPVAMSYIRECLTWQMGSDSKEEFELLQR
jgi:hypothetical protein